MYAGTNNPLYNFLSANHIKYDKLSVTFRTSPQEGINGKADLYGFRTDSLKLDTIYSIHSRIRPTSDSTVE